MVNAITKVARSFMARGKGKGSFEKVRLYRAAAGAAPGLAAVARAAVPATAALMMEPLEGRAMMSASINSAGWTVVTPPSDARIIYVSSSTGSDNNTGLSPQFPVASISKGKSVLENNSADELLLKRGDSWNSTFGRWTLSGASPQDPMVIGAYGSACAPEVLTGVNDGIDTGSMSHPEVDNLDIIGVNFDSSGRDPSIAGYNPKANAMGIVMTAQSDNILVEDCEIQNYTQNISIEDYFGPVANVTIRRNVIVDAYSVTSAHSEGIYSNGVSGLTIQDNVLDHNGWSSVVPGAYKTIYNHDCYLSADNSGVVVTGNIFANASSHGLQARAGGIVENNLFINDAIAMSYGMVNGSPMTPGGVSGTVSGNVIVGGTNIGSLSRGEGIEIGNVANATFSGNLIADGLSTGMAAFSLEAGAGVFNPTQAVGINDLTLTDNVVYNWAQGVSIAPNITPGTTGLYGLNHLAVANNDFQDISTAHIVQDLGPLDNSQEAFSGNTYNGTGAGGLDQHPGQSGELGDLDHHR